MPRKDRVKPWHKHDGCPVCVFVGHYHDGTGRKIDLYVHPMSNDGRSSTVIARYDDDEYQSGLGASFGKHPIPELKAARRRGFQMGLLNEADIVLHDVRITLDDAREILSDIESFNQSNQ